jgi:hypothetical protein
MVYKKSRKTLNKGKKGSRKTLVRSRKSPRKSAKRVTKSSCQRSLQKKIAINMDEYKQGRYVSRQQAVAVSYSQVKKARPGCSRYFKRK